MFVISKIRIFDKRNLFSFDSRPSQLGGAHANEIKHYQSAVGYVVLDPSFDKSCLVNAYYIIYTTL